MKKPTTICKESVSEYREYVELRSRKRVLGAIEVVLEEEVDQLPQRSSHWTVGLPRRKHPAGRTSLADQDPLARRPAA